ncbi:NAD(P)/FAD-dependent oxidoreductase [Mucilaginibacter ginkgonis]|uniref:FAD-binding oxidoreductase n=1 Tax=Mucilaginibacter ginkgonis TaxID=2682091 RepID=A0A6I4HY60_9SPHI|nr:FAD-binding oxidoreductase [Mucilaginibacter ginkgonis]QQL49516.1 FAD-binding oxidoreductase [Mucilaginibacter ginkgonis]
MSGTNDNYSYWERSAFVDAADIIVIGSGLVGLSAALHLKTREPNLRVTVLDSGFLPSGASTKNAGFACFGTISEQLAYINKASEDEMLRLVEYKYRGLQNLRNLLGDDAIRYEQHGGYELFSRCETHNAQQAIEAIPRLNKLISSVTGDTDIYAVADEKITGFGFRGVKYIIRNKYEGQINTGLMMRALLAKAQQSGVLILNNCQVQNIEDTGAGLNVVTNNGIFKAPKVIVANNAFAKGLYPELDVVPGRGQVIVTKPIPGLKVKGTFHFDEGYYYFRNVDDRVLFGGGRNLDIKTEETTEFGHTSVVQQQLENYLKEMILPDQPFEIDMRWSGIMGFGSEILPIIKELQPNIFCAVRCNGMGIAMGSLVGKEAAELVIGRQEMPDS